MTTAIELSQTAVREELNRMLRGAKAPTFRSLREFAEQEIILPNGPHEGRRFKCDRQPYTRLLFDAIDSARWRRIAITGPSQSGKTLAGFVIPILYHLFELHESFLVGLPDMNMAQDKWEIDILPVIEASRYKSLLPERGEGSRGGAIKRAINFRNGVTLRFMSGGGGDKQRAAYTVRALGITEVDGLDEAGGASREADKISQLEARTEAFGDSSRIYLECTPSIETGRIWREYKQGTASRIVLPCPKCGEWVTPEREHLKGWQSATTVVEAQEKSAFHCPQCNESWNDDERRDANMLGKLLHAGQEITSAGDIEGDPLATDTLGFRWSAVNNMLATSMHLGAKEWRARNDPDEHNSETALRQFTYALPAKPHDIDLSQINAAMIMKKTTEHRRGEIPANVTHLALGVDLGKWLCHWSFLGFESDATTHAVDYGVVEVHSAEMGEELALLVALRELRDTVLDRYERMPDLTLVDSGWHPEAAYAFVQESGPAFRAAKGHGVGQFKMRPYVQPKSTGATIVKIGEHYHISRLKSPRLHLVEIDVDRWKSWLHARIRTPKNDPGSFKLFHVENPNDHLSFAKHLVAERERYKDTARGRITVFESVNVNNHYLDATMLACVAGHMSGVRLMQESVPPHQQGMTVSGARPGVMGDAAPQAMAVAIPESSGGMGGWFEQQRRNRGRGR